ncbi:damage-inducible protein [Arsukibacterium ikkense]|uniref:Damage-inducible protein n=1 Tax=Arsukibacterium ikkense TaxID=336831 RepID=A0A0M2VAL3_9GAMM|nr:YebG family protein [Arsukibacterium ikkense]KKO46670.1 damage-inducible protein [Arsukibacterium ikkense]
MAVVTKYIVERNGVEKMTFTSKAEADAYDKMLDTADELAGMLSASTLLADEAQTEALALYLAQHKDALLVALGAKKPAKAVVNTEQPAVGQSKTQLKAEPAKAEKKPATEQAA